MTGPPGAFSTGAVGPPGPTGPFGSVGVGDYISTFSNATLGAYGGSQVMIGFGTSIRYTPKKSGNTLVMFSGTVRNSSVGSTTYLTGRYGTGTPPVANSAVAGSVFGTTQENTGATATGQAGYTIMGVLQLTVGTQYWFDMSIWSSGGMSGYIANTQIIVIEF
jgi:hypothetical protein